MLVSLQKSYFYFFRAANELNSLLAGLNLCECYTQEKDKLFLSIPTKENEQFHLILSINPQDYSLQIKEQHFKAKKNTINFFSDFLPQKIIAVDIAKFDRIIRICLENCKLYIVFRGGKSNCFFESNNDKFLSFKKETAEHLLNIKQELAGLSWLNNSNEIVENLFSFNSINEMENEKYLSKDILKLSKTLNPTPTGVVETINSILRDVIAIGIDPESNKTFFQPFSTIPHTTTLELELLSSYFEACSSVTAIQSITSKKTDTINDIEKLIKKEIEKILKKKSNLKSRIENGSKENDYRKFGELLLTNINLISKGMSEVTLYDFEQKKETLIILKPELSPNEMVNYYFEKARSEKIEYEKSCKIFDQIAQKLSKLENLLECLKNNPDLEKLNFIKKELKMNVETKSQKEIRDKIPYRHFVIDDKYNFYVGKDSKNNDQLTTKFAKQNDFWFHARSVAGSHGVLRVENSKEIIPQKVLEKAASIVAFYSKAKTSKLAPVSYTLKKYVTKNSRHEPGQVSVLKEHVLLVKPEIPIGCIYQNE